MDSKMHTPQPQIPTLETPQQKQGATPVEQVAYKRLLWVAPLTALAAALAAAVVYVIASTLGAIPSTVRVPSPMGERPVTLGSVAITAVMATVWAVILFLLLGLLAPRPIRLFRSVALVVLLLSFTLPFTVPSIPPRMLAPLLLLHAVVAVVDVGLLTTLGRDEPSTK